MESVHSKRLGFSSRSQYIAMSITFFFFLSILGSKSSEQIRAFY